MMIRPIRPLELDAGERCSIDELKSIQLRRLQWSVEHAYRSIPHYRKSFDSAGVHPSDLKCLEDLALFPHTTKQDLRDHFPFGMFAVPRDRIARIHASSGTTGKPTVVGYTRTDLEIWADLVGRCIRAAGGRSGDLLMNSYGYGLFTGGLGIHYGAEKLGCTVVPMSGGQTEKQVQMIRDLQPDIITVTPSYLIAIAEEFERQGWDPRNSSLKIAICGAEPWTNRLRAEIEARWNINALDIYGLSEVMGPGVAAECIETKDGLVIWEDYFYPEIIDPISGLVMPDGEAGELVFTSLAKEAMPVIRYRTRDLSSLLPPTARPMRRMSKVVGRSDDMLIIRGVNVFPSQLEEVILMFASLSPQFELVLSRQGALDRMQVRVELRPESSSLVGDEVSNLGQTLRDKVKVLVGINTEVEVLQPNCLERSNRNKAVRVIDKRLTNGTT
jgi:phenylacetate-CoA ligase